MAGARPGHRGGEGWADVWAEIWIGMPPSSGEPRRMKRAMRATGLAHLTAEHLRLAAEHIRHID